MMKINIVKHFLEKMQHVAPLFVDLSEDKFRETKKQTAAGAATRLQ